MYKAAQVISAPFAHWLLNTLGFGEQFDASQPFGSILVGLPDLVGRVEYQYIDRYDQRLIVYTLYTEFSMGLQDFEKLFSLFQGDAPYGWHPLDSMVMCLPYVTDGAISHLHEEIADALLEHLLYYAHQGDDTTNGIFEQFISYAFDGHWPTVEAFACEMYARAHTLIRQTPLDGGDDSTWSDPPQISYPDDIPWKTANEMEHGPDYYRDSASRITY